MTTENYFESDEFKAEHEAYLRRNPRKVVESTPAEVPAERPMLPDLEIELDDDIEEDERLARRAFELANEMVGRGNEITRDHMLALRATAKLLTEQATRQIRGLWALPAFTGFGKSCSISAFAAAILLEEREDELPLLICQGTVEALGEMKTDIESLVPAALREGKIGVYHTTDWDVPKVPKEELRQYPILLVPHARLLTGKDLVDFMEFDGGRRRHLIHDESLIRNEGVGIHLGQLRYHASAIMSVLPKTYALHAFLTEALARVEDSVAKAIEKTKAGDPDEPVTFTLPDIGRRAISDGLSATQKILRKQKDDPLPKPVRLFLEVMAGKTVRVKPDTEDHFATLLQYRRLVHEDIQDGTIFDASGWLREIIKLDVAIKDATTEEVDDGRPAFVYRGDLRDLKSWEKVRLVWWKRSGGKSIIKRDYIKARKTGEVCFRSRHLAERLAKHPGERVLVVTFKDESIGDVPLRDRNSKDPWKRTPFRFRHELEQDLRALGVDVDEAVEVDGKQVPRLVWMTWGRVTGRNDARDCTVAYLHGVILRDHNELTATALGQLGDIHADVEEKIEALRQSEAAHEIYQAVSRVSCREMVGRYAKPATLYVTHFEKEAIDAAVREMNGVRVQMSAKAPGESAGDRRVSEGRTELVRRFTEVWKAIEGDEVTSAVIKARAMAGHETLFEGIKPDVISKAMTAAADQTGWERRSARVWVHQEDPFW